jgi:hypothetical protein
MVRASYLDNSSLAKCDSGLRAAQVGVVFKLPSQYGTFPHPLAYVEWFRPFTTRDATTGFFKVTQSTRNHVRHCQVVSLADILQGCHLAPKFGTTPVERSWTHLNVLDNAGEFFLNHYIDFHLFETCSI